MTPQPGAAFAPRWWRIAIAGAVGTLVVVFAGAAIADGYIQHPSAAAAVAVSLELMGTAALLGRRRWPATVLGVELAVAAITAAVAGPVIHSGPVFLAVVALYTFGTQRTQTQTILAGVVTGVTIAVVTCLEQGSLNPLVPDAALFTAVTAVSFYVRSHRALMVSYRERAEQAEEQQRWTTARAVAAERARIARELHDVVAHHVSLLVVQAGAVRATLPESHVTRPVLDSMIEGGRQAMGELRVMLDALRLDEGGGEGAAELLTTAAGEATDATGRPRGPQPTSDQIPALVTGAQAAGLPVTLHIEGPVVAAPPSTSLSAYRIVQEALTNALKHAPGAFTTVVLSYEPPALVVTIRNGPAPDLAHRSSGRTEPGHGIVGMRERVGLAHGSLGVGPTPDGWQVSARLPLDPPPQPVGPTAILASPAAS